MKNYFFVEDVNPRVDQLARLNRRVIGSLITDVAAAVEFCINQGLVNFFKRCRKCIRDMSVRTDSQSTGVFGAFICKNRNCSNRDKQYSRTRGTLFENRNLDPGVIISLAYSFSRAESYASAKLEAASDYFLRHNNGQQLSDNTIADWYSEFREIIVVDFLEEKRNERGQIGAPGSIVQIDESKFGSRKYNRGRQVVGYWVLGMIANDSDDFRLILCSKDVDHPEGKRSAAALLPIIQMHVPRGSQLHTDSWAVYDLLPQAGYQHKKVNHSDPMNRFVALDGTHTQRIEAQWRPVKDYFRERHVSRDAFPLALTEYAWRRWCRKNNVDHFENLLNAIKNIFPPA